MAGRRDFIKAGSLILLSAGKLASALAGTRSVKPGIEDSKLTKLLAVIMRALKE
ncbi:MAG: hypothetical protein WBI18_05425 [Candidatus Saccharicenans sp.]